MDERPASRRRPDTDTALRLVGLLSLAVVTLATVTLAAAGLGDDPLGTVTSSRLIPELVIAAVVATVLIGLTLWLVLPASPSPRRTPERQRSPWWARPLGLVAWLFLVVVLVVVAQRMTTGTDTPETAERLDPDQLAFLSVQAPTDDASRRAVVEVDARLMGLEPIEEIYTDAEVDALEGEADPLVPPEAAADGAEVVVVRLDRRADTLGGPAARTLVDTLDDIDRSSPVTLVLRDAAGDRLDLVDPSPSGETDGPGASGSALIDLAITVGSILVALVLVAGLVAALVRRRSGGPGSGFEQGEASAGPRLDHRHTGPAMRDALRRAHDGLAADADPRLAVIAAYWEMERAMADAGVPPGPAETSTEFLARCLATVGPAAGAARRLTELFDWAMFSHHAITPAMRDDARSALAAVIDGLDRPMSTRGLGP